MVVFTVVSAATIICTGGAAAPAVGAAAAEGILAGTAGATAAAAGTVTTGVAVAGATGTAAASGAITGAVAGGSLTSVAVGSVVGGASAAGVSATGGGAAAAASAGLLAGPVGWICLGTDEENGNLSFDCWKPLLHDESKEPSEGMLLRDVFMDPRIKDIEVSNDVNPYYPEIRLTNTWDEEFEIQYVRLPSGQLAAHAVRCFPKL